MRKIERWNEVTEDIRAVFMKTKPSEIMMWDKINELCDAINELRGWLSGEAQDVLIAGGRSVSPKGSPDSVGSNPKPLSNEPTQEPESVVGKYAHIPCSKCGHAEKEPECEHDFDSWTSPCKKCGFHELKEKPAKKDEGVSEGVKDELVERLQKAVSKAASKGKLDFCTDIEVARFVADEARKWAVEVVEEILAQPPDRIGEITPDLYWKARNLLIERLKDGRD